MLQLQFQKPGGPINGGDDMMVYTQQNKTNHEWEGWVDQSPLMAMRTFRNVGAFPIAIHNPDNVDIIGFSVAEHPEYFVNSAYGPVLKDSLEFEILNEDDTLIKRQFTSFALPVVKNGVAMIPANSTIYPVKPAWLDKSGAIPNGDMVFVGVEFRMPTPSGLVSCNLYGIPFRFYPGAALYGPSVNRYFDAGA